jgi:hypothetical protein
MGQSVAGGEEATPLAGRSGACHSRPGNPHFAYCSANWFIPNNRYDCYVEELFTE